MSAAVDVLKDVVIKSAIKAENNFDRSLNDLPEYFLTVNVATDAAKGLACLAEMEVDFSVLCRDLNISAGSVSRAGKADVVLRHSGNRKPKHIIELKRSVHKGRLQDDAIRLAQMCVVSPSKSRVRSNYLIIVTHLKRRLMSRRNEVSNWLRSASVNGVNFVCHEIDGLKKFTNHRKTSAKNIDGHLYGEVWEFTLKSNVN